MGKRIRILAMGGTIAGQAGDSTATTGYQAGAVGNKTVTLNLDKSV
jgi:L-asparaginase